MGIPALQPWFKPYSLSRRKEAAAKIMRHFCARSKCGLCEDASKCDSAGADRAESALSRGKNRILAAVGADWAAGALFLGIGRA